MTAHLYIVKYLGGHVVTFAFFISNNFILVDDNARPYVVRIVNEYRNEAGIIRTNWPAQSPDFNLKYYSAELTRSYKLRFKNQISLNNTAIIFNFLSISHYR